MLSAIFGPSAASPLVSLSLSHIARTPVQRLGVSYQIEPTYNPSTSPASQSKIVEWYSVPLGVGLYLDSLLGGGVDGQPLPLWISVTLPSMPGSLDVMA